MASHFVFTPEDMESLLKIHRGLYLTAAALALFYYDWASTLSEEFRYIWKRKWTMITILFLLNRYITFIGFLLVIYVMKFDNNFLNPPSEQCRRSAFIVYPAVIISQAMLTLILIIRTYAFCKAKRWILILLSFIGTISMLLNIWRISPLASESGTASYVLSPSASRTCVILPTSEPSGRPLPQEPTFSLEAWGVTVIFDLLVFIFTISHNIHLHRLGRGLVTSSVLITQCLRDGSLYFAFLLLANVAMFILYLQRNPLAIPLLIPSIPAQTTLPVVSISTIMVSKLIFNIRRAGDRTRNGGYDAGDRSVSFFTSHEIVQELSFAEVAVPDWDEDSLDGDASDFLHPQEKQHVFMVSAFPQSRTGRHQTNPSPWKVNSD